MDRHCRQLFLHLIYLILSLPFLHRISPAGAPAWSFPVAILFTMAIGIADYLSGYEYRLAMLYLAPLALATWSFGVWAGMIAAMVAVLCWLASFYSRNFYTNQLFLVWEAVELLVIFTIFVQVFWQLRKALMRADERFKRVLEGLDAGIYVIIPATGEIAYTNPQIGTMLGADHDESAVSRFEASLDIPYRSAKFSLEAFCSWEVWIEERRRYYLVQSGLIPWDKKAAGRLTVVRDITNQKAAESARREQHEKQSNIARSAVLAEISTTLGHELSQPLMAISSYLEASLILLAKKDLDSADVFPALKKCQQEAARASRILHGLRNFLRQRIPATTSSDLNAAIRQVVKTVTENNPDAGNLITLELSDVLPSTLFDQTLIEQVMLNLITNAVQAVGAGTNDGIIIVKSEPSEKGANVSVIDNGPGVSQSMEQELFKPFFTTKPNGLGLGLSICRSVIEAHGGNISQHRNQFGGAAFCFFLPAA